MAISIVYFFEIMVILTKLIKIYMNIIPYNYLTCRVRKNKYLKR